MMFKNANRVKTSVRLEPSNEIPNSQFVARFSVDQGSNLHASVRLKLEKAYDGSSTKSLADLNWPLYVYLIEDEHWEQVLNSKDCNSVGNLAKFQIGESSNLSGISSNLRGDGEWGSWKSYEDQQIPNSQVWYVVVSDCSGGTHQAYPSLSDIEVDLHLLNSGSEFSNEEKGVVTMYVILLLVYMYFLISTTTSLVRSAMDKTEVEIPIMGCIFAVYMELLHIAAQCIHLYIYSSNGSGFFVLNLASTILQMNSQIIIIGMLIMIANGWLITNVDITENNKLMVLGAIV